MFLRPQQFQAMDRARVEELAVATAASEPCSYGIVRLEIDPAALAARQFELRRGQARLRDGTLGWLPARGGAPRDTPPPRPHPTPSATILHHPTPSDTIRHHPTPSGTIRHHLTPSHTI